MHANRKSYLGDAVYAEFDGVCLVLTTEDGLRATNRIVLEPEVWEALIGYANRVRKANGLAPLVPERP